MANDEFEPVGQPAQPNVQRGNPQRSDPQKDNPQRGSQSIPSDRWPREDLTPRKGSRK
jgi:hypothetical protein